MIIDLLKLGENRREFALEIDPGEIDLESEHVELTDRVRFRGTLDNRPERVEIEGRIEAAVSIACDRCLREVPRDLSFEFRNAFITPEEYTEEQETELEIEDMDVSIFQGGSLDLREIAREQLLLALPGQVLCEEDCRGLCGRCGANRNLVDCNCAEEETDPRWSALKDLKIENED